MIFVTGDTWTVGTVQLFGSDGNPPSLTADDTVRAAFRAGNASVVGPITLTHDGGWASGQVTIEFAPTDTALTTISDGGRLMLEVEVQYLGGKVETWLSANNIYTVKRDTI